MTGVEMIPAREAMERCACAMHTMHPEDDARPDVRAIYSAAAQIETSWAVGVASHTQYDDRIAVPNWLMEYGGPARGGSDG